MKKLDNLQEVKNYFDVPDEAIAFLEAANEQTACGRYEFGPDCYINVMMCDTTNDPGYMEAHKIYVDLQYLITGEERILYTDTTSLKAETPYDAEKDYGMYYYDTADTVIYRAGEGVLLYPVVDGHLPCRAVTAPMQLKKAVMKIRYTK